VATERVVATAKTVQVWYDYSAGRPVALTEENKLRLSRPVEA
jgi:acyl-CoA thioesterase FadM